MLSLPEVKASVKAMFGVGISMKAWRHVLRLSLVTLSHLRVSPAFYSEYTSTSVCREPPNRTDGMPGAHRASVLKQYLSLSPLR